MMLDARLHYTPRTAPQETETPDILVPALAGLRACKTAFETVKFAEALPDMILPALAWEASRRRTVPPVAIKALIRYCGPLFLERCLGKRRAIQLRARYPTIEAISGL